MELKENMYVRTSLGVGKIIKFYGDLIKIDLGYRTTIDYKSQLFNTIKASDKLIDLVEENDFVNGYRVLESMKNNRKKEPSTMVYCEFGDGFIGYYNEEIKTIITKEMFDQMSYKVGE